MQHVDKYLLNWNELNWTDLNGIELLPNTIVFMLLLLAHLDTKRSLHIYKIAHLTVTELR